MGNTLPMFTGSHQMPNDFQCCSCSHQFTEAELIIERGTFYSACPSCGSEDIKDAPLMMVAARRLESLVSA